MPAIEAKFCNRCGRPLDREGLICSHCLKEQEQARNGRHKAYRKAYSAARHEAERRVRVLHAEQYEQFLREELEKRHATSTEVFETALQRGLVEEGA